MNPQDYATDVKNRFGDTLTGDGRFIRELDDRELVQRMVTKYPSERYKIVGIDEFLTPEQQELVPPESKEDKKVMKFQDRVGNVLSAFQNRFGAMAENTFQSDERLSSKILQNTGQVVGLAGDLAGEALGAVTPDVIKEPAKALIGGAVQSVAESPVGQMAGDAWASLDEETQQNLEAIANIGTSLPPIKGASMLAKAGKEGLEEAVETGAKVAVKETADAVSDVDRVIVDAFNRAIKPSVAGKSTLGQTDKFNSQIVDGVKTIARNKENLRYTTPDGDEVIGAPQSIRQFAEAVDQTKKTIFDQYDSLAKQAGGMGVKIDLGGISKELDAVINNQSLQLSHPGAIKYAKELQTRLSGVEGGLDPKTLQELIKNYNSSLESFYKNPSYDTASNAAIDAFVVNKLRESLDKAIEGATGTQYQALKAQYASLKAIEKDVVKKANMEARKNSQGLIDYTDIFSGGDIVSGILTLNPAIFAKGVAQKSIKEMFKMLNDPNRIIKKMFESVGE